MTSDDKDRLPGTAPPESVDENGPPPLPRTFAPAEEADDTPGVEWRREDAQMPAPPPPGRLREALNAIRVALGFRRLPEGVRLDHGLPRLRRLLPGEDRRALRLTMTSLAAAAAFAVGALVIISGYGAVARGPTAIEAAQHREILLQAMEMLRTRDVPAARVLRDQLAAAGPADPSLHFLDGYLLAVEGADESEVVRRLSRRAWTRPRRVTNLVTLAGFHEARGDAAAAATILQQAAKIAPQNISLQVLMAASLLATGRFDEAARTATAIEASHGPNALIFGIRGLAYLGAGQPDRARREFSLGLLYEPEAARLRLNLATALIELGEHRRAFAELQRARQYYPNNADVYAQLGLLREQTGDLTGAERTYRRAIELDPDHANALNNLAYLLAAKMSSPSAALPYAQRAHKLAPHVAPVLDTLGWTYHLLGRHREALPLLEDAARRAPDDREIRSHLAQVRRALREPARPPAPASRNGVATRGEAAVAVSD